MKADDEIWNDLFHGCAWVAFLEQAHAQQGWPDKEATRRRAYELYEVALAERNAAKRPRPRCPAARHGPRMVLHHLAADAKCRRQFQQTTK
jgi:hypothetical protein